MTTNRNIFIISSLIFVLVIFLNNAKSQMLFPNEQLEYRVSFLGITIGHIYIDTEQEEELNGNKTIKTKGYMESNPDIPFIDLRAIYLSWLDPSGNFSHKFIGKVRLSDGTWDYQQIDFDYKDKIIKNVKFAHKRKFIDTSFHTSRKTQDGLALFFFARQNLKVGKSLKIPTIVDRDIVYTNIDFKNIKQTTEIDALDYKVQTVYFYGKANWTGIYGLTGEFEGWFSDDSARVPIVARMKVYVGSIYIELIKWKRGTWQPPKEK